MCFPQEHKRFPCCIDAWLLAWRVMLTITQDFKILALYTLQLLRPPTVVYRPQPTNQRSGAALLGAGTVKRQLMAGYNKSSEMKYFHEHFQNTITKLNLARFVKSLVVLNFSLTVLLNSCIGS